MKTAMRKMVEWLERSLTSIGSSEENKRVTSFHLLKARSLLAEEKAQKSVCPACTCCETLAIRDCAIDDLLEQVKRLQTHEPLAELADRKGVHINYHKISYKKYHIIWVIVTLSRTRQNTSEHWGDSYGFTEAKAREYLNGLEDKK